MIQEEQFKSIVDSVKPSLEAYPVDLSKLYNHFEMSIGSSLTVNHVISHLESRIVETLVTSNEGFYSRDFWLLFKQLVRQQIIERSDLVSYLSVADTLKEASRKLQKNQRFLFFDKNKEWKDAIKLIKDVLILRSPYPNQYTNADNELRFPRLSKPAKGLIWLNEHSFDGLSVESGRFQLPDDQLKVLIESIEKDLRSLGGLKMAVHIFIKLSERFDSALGRYHLCRNCPNTGQEVSAQIPLGYVLNLCIKANNLIGGELTQEVIERFKDELIALGCLYDVQPYSRFEIEFQTVDTLIDFLREISLYDSLFLIRQLRPSDIVKLIQNLFDWVDNSEMQEKLRWNMTQAVEVINAILRLTPPQKTVFFNTKDVITNTQNVNDGVVEIILKAFSHVKPGPNHKFSIPHEVESIDYQFKPLLQIEQDYCLMDLSWCSVGFYEAVASVIRSYVGSERTQERIGLAGERFLKRELVARNVSYSSGKYSYNGKQWECDCVIETKEAIIFIELKSKVLTRKAQGGNDVKLLVDISKSLIDSQIQLGNHEIAIRKQRYLDLEDSSGTTYRLEHKDRGIERISLTLLDYGGIQDRRVIAQLMRLVTTAQFNAVDPKHQVDFDELNEKCRELYSQEIELCKIDVKHKIPYFNSWFLSIPQFLVLLDEVRSNEDFKRELWSTRHLTFSSLDFYFEINEARKMRALSGA